MQDDTQRVEVETWAKQLSDLDVEVILKEHSRLPSSAATEEESKQEAFFKGMVTAILSQENKERIRVLARSAFFKRSEVLLPLLKELASQLQAVNSDESKWAAIFLLKSLPKSSITPATATAPAIEQCWLELTALDLSPAMLRSVLPYFTERLMDAMPNAELFADFLYRTFNKGNYRVLSLTGIFKLIVHRNFEHPSFYGDVYAMVRPGVCYSSYAQKFFAITDIILSSSHVPVYVITAFVKRLGRVLLNAPVDCQLPLLTLIKNLLRRHSVVHSILIDREEPKDMAGDPYDPEELDLQKCKADESSLWELKAIQQHWHPKVAERANFINQHSQDHEQPIEWTSKEGVFEAILDKSMRTLNRIYSGGSGEGAEEGSESGEEEESMNGGGSEPPIKRRKGAGAAPAKGRIPFKAEAPNTTQLFIGSGGQLWNA